MDEQRIGASLRALRIRRRLRQLDVATAAGIPRGVAMRIEAGRLDQVRFGDIRRHAAALGARFDGSVLWQGADLDRMLNRGHARLHDAMARWLADVGGWVIRPEVSFTGRHGRGVIDIVAWNADVKAVLVIELKTRIVDINDLTTTMDVRRHVATSIAREHGWDPRVVGLWVVVAPSRTSGRVLAEHATVLRAKFPADGRAMRRWLTRPSGAIAAFSFMPHVRLGDSGQSPVTPRRVRAANRSVESPSTGPGRPREPRIGVTFRD